MNHLYLLSAYSKETTVIYTEIIFWFRFISFILTSYFNKNVYFLSRDLILAAILQGKYPDIYEGFTYLVFLHGLSFYLFTFFIKFNLWYKSYL